MRRFAGVLLAVMLLALCATTFAAPKLVLTDTQEIPNSTFRGGYAANPFEGKIVMSAIKGSKTLSKPWIGFYALGADGKTVKFDLEFSGGNIQVCVLYDGGRNTGFLERKYLLRQVLPTHDMWHYNGPFSIEVRDGCAVVTLGSQSYTWPGVSTLNGVIEVGMVSGKLDIYHYVEEDTQ